MYFDPRQTYSSLCLWLSRRTGKRQHLEYFTKTLSRFLNQQGHPVKFKIHLVDNQELDLGQFTIGGQYDPWLDEQGHRCIFLYLIINPAIKNYWSLSEHDCAQLGLELVETLSHEYVHRLQYQSRDFQPYRVKYTNNAVDFKRTQEIQNYLGSADEIEAYAMNIAVRLFLTDKQLNTNVLSTNHDFQHYITTFGNKHKIIKKLLTLIEKNLANLKDCKNGQSVT